MEVREVIPRVTMYVVSFALKGTISSRSTGHGIGELFKSFI